MGDMVSGITTLFQGSPGSAQTTPRSGAQGVLRGYESTAPGVLDLNRRFQPEYLNLGESNLEQLLLGGAGGGGLLNLLMRVAPELQNLSGESFRTGTGNTLATLGEFVPQLRDIYEGSRPESMELMRRLTRTATEGLDLGGRLMPEDVSRITSGVRGDWAARGLGASSPAGMDEAVQLATAGEGVRAGRQAFAGDVARLVESATPNYASMLYSMGQDIMPSATSLVTGQQPLTYQRWYDPYNPSGTGLAELGARLKFAGNQATSQAAGNTANGVGQLISAFAGI